MLVVEEDHVLVVVAVGLIVILALAEGVEPAVPVRLGVVLRL